jgi:nucleoside-diphosphate-sugar epimerase
MKWLNREDDIYDEVKRQAECAICQAYPHINSVMVRFPFVIGTDDFTERFKFYVEHILQNKAMNVDNLTAQMSFVRSDEAGRFLAYLAESEFTGVINGASEQTVSIQDVAAYVALKTGKKPIFSPYGDVAPYNGENEYSINVDRAKSLEFYFTPLNDWIFELIDYYIEKGEDST